MVSSILGLQGFELIYHIFDAEQDLAKLNQMLSQACGRGLGSGFRAYTSGRWSKNTWLNRANIANSIYI